MANEMDLKQGAFPITILLAAANPAANATAALKFSSGGLGFTVPTGYRFHPLYLKGESNADLTAGTATFKVTYDTVALANGPVADLADTVQTDYGLAEIGDEPAEAGVVVGVSVTTNAAYLPVTADLDCILIGVLTQA
jgi:hypothetical protein